MAPNNQSQNQTNGFPTPKPIPPAHQPKDVMDKDARNEEDFKADEKETTGEEDKNVKKEESQSMPANHDNDDWKTRDSGIPENASDNPNS